MSARPDPVGPVPVCREHFLKVLRAFKDHQISQEDLATWIYTIRFTDGLFEVCEDSLDSCFGVMDEIQFKSGRVANIPGVREVDIHAVVDGREKVEVFQPISCSEIEKYIEAVANNVDLWVSEGAEEKWKVWRHGQTT